MTVKDKLTIHRMLGKIEGVASVVEEDAISAVLLDAVEIIDSVIERQECDTE